MDEYYDAFEMDDAYAKLIQRMNPPRVEFDNIACDNATVIRVDCVNRQGILLDVVQILTDLNLVVTKAYISSDGGWFMDVFNVTDCEGNKLVDREVMDCIRKTMESDACIFPSTRSSAVNPPLKDYTLIELTGMDRPGLLSEVCAVLSDLKCNILRVEVWTHNTRAAAIAHVVDMFTNRVIEDETRLSTIKALLGHVLRGSGLSRAGGMRVSKEAIHTERRLHQLMYDDRDYERVGCNDESDGERPHVALLDCFERDYTVAILKSKDRPKLLFDTICTLTDMQYTVFHGTVHTADGEAYQEYYIRHADGLPVSSEGERQRVIQCLEAAIERRTSEGLVLELKTEDRARILSEITRVFRENSLTIRKAKISTKEGKVVGTFHVSDMSGCAVDTYTINSIQQQIGGGIVTVKQDRIHSSKVSVETIGFLFGNLLRACSFQNFRLIRSYT